MAGTKGSHVSEKLEEAIPLPPFNTTPQSSVPNLRRTRTRKVFLRILTFTLLFFTVHHWYKRSNPEIEEEVESWYANPFSVHRPGIFRAHHGFGHGTGHRVLNGKLAEKLFLEIPDADSAIAASRQYATKPHLAGSEGDFQTAKDFLALLQQEFNIGNPDSIPLFSAGSSASRNATLSIPSLNSPTAWIDTYYPILNTPLDRSLEILSEDGEAVWKANLEEVADELDPDANKYADAVPSWHGLSKGGEVKGKLVYAHYGRQEDYQALIEKGVNLTGTIVLTRYGGIFRGLKVKGAQELGAAGVIIYSDTRDDGTVTERNGYLPYPNGPARNPTSVQRGSVQFLSLYPGDPTTPGYPSYENSTRTAGVNIPSIPSLPISWQNAQVLLKEIENGGQNRTVSLVNHVNNKVTPIWNTIGVIPGHIKDEVVVVGNHRDAWVLGATDPSSGTASIHEVVKGLGALLQKGWKPLRTIVVASWDAEEYGLIGSTEWGEDFAEWIDEHVVAYVNLDSSVSGSRFRSSASPSLAHLVRSSAEKIPHPTKPDLTLWDATKDGGILFGDQVDTEVLQLSEAELQAADALGVSPLGSGSDYTVFLQRIGVASTNGGFGSTLHDPVYHYHSVFDSQRWQELFGDPGFHRHVAVAKHLGLQTLGLADSIILPLNTTHYSFELKAYLEEVESIASSLSLEVDFSSLRTSIIKLQSASAKLDKKKLKALDDLKRLIKKVVRRHIFRRKVRKLLCKIKKVFGKECVCPGRTHLQEIGILNVGTNNGNGLKPRIGRYPAWIKEQQGQIDRSAHHAHGKHGFPKKKFEKILKRIRNINKKLVAFERGFIHEDGIKDREWYRHLGVAPGKWLGYGATTLPALTEALTIEKNTTLAKYEADRVQALIDNLTKKIKP